MVIWIIYTIFFENLNLFWTNLHVILLGVKITPERDKIESINYLPKIPKIKGIFNTWDTEIYL